jgi:hypothetical protein
VVEPAAVEGAALEVVLGRTRAGEELPDGRELLGPGSMRGARDRHVLLREIVVGTHEQEGLDRLGGRAHERNAPWIAACLDERAVSAHAGGMDAVAGLGHTTADGGYCERIHGRGA